jgi:hypothetical protein
VRAEDVLYDFVEQGESQTVEFKASLSLQKEAIQAMVAFANSQGGWLFFGVTDDRQLKGVEIGANTLGRLATAIRDRTYPSLPVAIEAIPSQRDRRKHIVAVEIPSDVPPVIGVYLYSERSMDPSEPADVAKVQAYRRVGRMNQKEDFMRLRQPQPSDPRVRVALGQAQTGAPSFPTQFEGFVWTEEGSPTAHDVTFRIDPPVAHCHDAFSDIPGPAAGIQRKFTISCAQQPDADPSAVRLIASFKDDRGLTWESSRRLDVVIDTSATKRLARIADGGEFNRRIVGFPPKAQ